MRKIFSVNIILQIFSRALLFVLLTGISFSVEAQSYEDSTAIIDPAPDTAIITDDEEEYQVTEQKNSFLERSGEDSFLVNGRNLPPDHAKKLKEDKDFWYADTGVQKKEKKQEKAEEDRYVPLGQRSWFQTLLWLVIIAAFAGAIMWYLTDSNVSLFRKKDTATDGDTGNDEIPEDIFAINYQREIDKAAAQGNYRLAVRLMYLRLLKNLADKDIIQYKQDKTNFDYLLQLHPTRHYNNFFRLTRHYEYSWYGHFDVEENAYKIIKNEFHQFDREIN